MRWCANDENLVKIFLFTYFTIFFLNIEFSLSYFQNESKDEKHEQQTETLNSETVTAEGNEIDGGGDQSVKSNFPIYGNGNFKIINSLSSLLI